MKVLSMAALMLATAGPALADPSVEVMHFWTSGGEAAAFNPEPAPGTGARVTGAL